MRLPSALAVGISPEEVGRCCKEKRLASVSNLKQQQKKHANNFFLRSTQDVSSNFIFSPSTKFNSPISLPSWNRTKGFYCCRKKINFSLTGFSVSQVEE